MICKQYTQNYIYTFRNGPHARGDIYKKKEAYTRRSLSRSPPVDKREREESSEELDLDRDQPPRLPFLVNALLTNQQVVMPLCIMKIPLLRTSANPTSGLSLNLSVRPSVCRCHGAAIVTPGGVIARNRLYFVSR